MEKYKKKLEESADLRRRVKVTIHKQGNNIELIYPTSSH
jgi:hypothetical protein